MLKRIGSFVLGLMVFMMGLALCATVVGIPLGIVVVGGGMILMGYGLFGEFKRGEQRSIS